MPPQLLPHIFDRSVTLGQFIQTVWSGLFRPNILGIRNYRAEVLRMDSGDPQGSIKHSCEFVCLFVCYKTVMLSAWTTWFVSGKWRSKTPFALKMTQNISVHI